MAKKAAEKIHVIITRNTRGDGRSLAADLKNPVALSAETARKLIALGKAKPAPNKSNPSAPERQKPSQSNVD